MGRYLIGAALTGTLVGLIDVIANLSDNAIFWTFLAATGLYCAGASYHESRTSRKTRVH